MGLLDDAIREHLELKRRRGADSSEVARQEQEAFGPPRRGDFEVAPAEALDEPATFADEGAISLRAVEDLPPAQTEPPRPHGDPADDLPRAEPVHAPVHEEPPAAEEPEPDEPVAHEAPLVPPPAVQPTREFDASELRAATAPPAAPARPAPEPVDEPEPEPEPEPEEPAAPAPRADEEERTEDPEDVLEETPEFLQETPEHDRLWFEQRPPRDFDF